MGTRNTRQIKLNWTRDRIDSASREGKALSLKKLRANLMIETCATRKTADEIIHMFIDSGALTLIGEDSLVPNA